MKRGFTLIEILIVLGVIAILLSIIIPAFRGMQEEGKRTKAQKETETCQVAIESYYKNYDSYPPNLDVLTGCTPLILSEKPEDPFRTLVDAADKGVFTYSTGTDAAIGIWYMVGSQGPDRTWQSSYSAGNWYILGDDILATNAPKHKQ